MMDLAITTTKKQLTNAQVEKKRQRNLRRRNAKKANLMGRMSQYTPGPMMTVAPSVDTAIRNAVKRISGRLTSEGMSFLKCAFAPPDFASNNVGGVPDDFQGLSLVKRHRLIGNLSSLIASNTDVYIILAPVPGYAYFYLTKAAGVLPVATDIFLGVPYADSGSLFSSTTTAADIVSDFRFMSNHIEIIPTVNQMAWTGSIQTMRIKLSQTIRVNYGTTGAQAANILGLNGLNAIVNFGNVQQYTSPVINGMYTGAYNSGVNFPFTAVSENSTMLPNILSTASGDWGALSSPGSTGAFAGLDNNFDSIAVKISGMGATNNNSFIIKTWSCVEYKVVSGSVLYEYQTNSPCDEYSLKLYREIIKDLPIAVTYSDNENFWTRVLSIIRRASGALSVIPGPYGSIAGGVNAITTGIESLL